VGFTPLHAAPSSPDLSGLTKNVQTQDLTIRVRQWQCSPTFNCQYQPEDIWTASSASSIKETKSLGRSLPCWILRPQGGTHEGLGPASLVAEAGYGESPPSRMREINIASRVAAAQAQADLKTDAGRAVS